MLLEKHMWQGGIEQGSDVGNIQPFAISLPPLLVGIYIELLTSKLLTGLLVKLVGLE